MIQMDNISINMQVIELASTLALRTVNSCFDSITIARTVIGEGYIKQRYGEWKWISDDDCICSECGKGFYTADNADAGLWKFCPNCGAKMKGGAE